jgi:hypothetical protein
MLLNIGILIVLILLLIWWFGSVVGGSVAVAGFVILALNKSENRKYGNWECKLDSDRPYGNRCDDSLETLGISKEECEAKCLGHQEILPDPFNIKKFILDRGIKMPMSAEFLDSITPGSPLFDEFNEFIKKQKYKVIFALCQKSPIFRNHLFNNIPNLRISAMHLRKDDDKFIWYIKNEKGIYETLNCITDMADIVAPNNDNPHYINLGLSYPAPHANSIIIDHKFKRIFHIEPHVGSRLVDGDWYKEIHDEISRFTEPLKYILHDTGSCPVGLQSVTGDSLCYMWEILISYMTIINGDKSLYDIMQFMIGTKNMAAYILNVFAFYLSKLDVSRNFNDAVDAKSNHILSCLENAEILESIYKDNYEMFEKIGEPGLKINDNIRKNMIIIRGMIVKFHNSDDVSMSSLAIFSYLLNDYVKFIKKTISDMSPIYKNVNDRLGYITDDMQSYLTYIDDIPELLESQKESSMCTIL